MEVLSFDCANCDGFFFNEGEYEDHTKLCKQPSENNDSGKIFKIYLLLFKDF